MKNFAKIIALVCAVCMVVVCFAACGEKPANTPEETTAAPAEAPVDFTGKTLTMGTNAAFPPYEFVNDDGSFGGIDVEIAGAVAAKLGMTLEIKDMEFDSLLAAVDEGAIDVVLAGLTVTEERLESVNFSDSYATGKQVIIVAEGSDITDANLEGKMIGVQAGTTGDIYCTDDYGQENVKQYQNGALAVQALLNGQVDCVVIDNEPAKNYVEANDGLVILETEYITENYAAAFDKENTALLDAFNAALAELKADGTIDTIIAKYIHAD